MAAFSLEPDCQNCVGFCCVALAFDQGDHFAINKDAGIPCPHLQADHYCDIHASLKQKGFSGCVRYNCFGAGQRVAQEIFPNQTWRDNPEHANLMFEVFSIVEKIHVLISMLNTAEKLNLPPHLERERLAYQQKLEALSTKPDDLKQVPLGSLRKQIEQFLAGLRDQISPDALKA